MEFEDFSHSIRDFKSLNNGEYACCSRYSVSIIDPKQEYKLLTNLDHEDEVTWVTQLKDGKLASASSDCTIKIWDSKNNYICCNELKGHSGSVNCLPELKDQRLIIGSSDCNIKIWDPLLQLYSNIIKIKL